MKIKNAVRTTVAGLGVAALALAAPLSASAATVSLDIDNGAGSTPTAIYKGGTGSHTVEVSGENFEYDPYWAGWPFSDAGIYVAFGPDLSIAGNFLNANAFAAHAGGQFWVHNGADLSESNQWELSTDGVFTDVPLVVQSTFQNGSDTTFTCTTGPDDTTSGRVDCFVYTLSAHGSPERGNDNKIPVYFGTE